MSRTFGPLTHLSVASILKANLSTPFSLPLRHLALGGPTISVPQDVRVGQLSRHVSPKEQSAGPPRLGLPQARGGPSRRFSARRQPSRPTPRAGPVGTGHLPRTTL